MTRDGPTWCVEEVGVVSSTQALLKERLGRGEAVSGVVLRATAQTGGAGRRGSSWYSGPGGSYQSMALEQDSRVAVPSVTLAVGVALAEAFRAEGAEVWVKWPNDLVKDDAKLAGILVEGVRGHVIVGVGVNVDNELPDGGSAMTGWSVDAVSGLVLRAVGTALASYAPAQSGPVGFVAGAVVAAPVTDGRSPAEPGGLVTRFGRVDWLRGKSVTVEDAMYISDPSVGAQLSKGPLEGVAAGVDGSGALLVRTADGSVAKVYGGSLRSAYGRAAATRATRDTARTPNGQA